MKKTATVLTVLALITSCKKEEGCGDYKITLSNQGETNAVFISGQLIGAPAYKDTTLVYTVRPDTVAYMDSTFDLSFPSKYVVGEACEQTFDVTMR